MNDDPLGLNDPLGLDDPLGLGNEPERTNWKEDLAQGFAGVGNTADRFLTFSGAGLASILGQNRGGKGELTDEMFANMEERIRQRNEWAGGQGKEKGLAGHLISAGPGLLGLPLLPVSGLDRSADLIQKGVPVEKAALAGAVDSSINLAANAIPIVGKTLMGRAGMGAVSNAAAGAVSDTASNLITGEKHYDPLDLNQRLSEAIIGGGAGTLISNKPKATNEHNLNLDTTATPPEVANPRAEALAQLDAQLAAQRRAPVLNELDASLQRPPMSMEDQRLRAPIEQLELPLHNTPEQIAEMQARPDQMDMFAGNRLPEQVEPPVGRMPVHQDELPDFTTPEEISRHQADPNQPDMFHEQPTDPFMDSMAQKNMFDQEATQADIARQTAEHQAELQKQREIEDAYAQREESIAQEKAFARSEELQKGIEEPLRQGRRVPRSQLGAVDVGALGLNKSKDPESQRIANLNASSPEIQEATAQMATDAKRAAMAASVGEKYGNTFSKVENVIAALLSGKYKDISWGQKSRGKTVSPGMNAVAINTKHPLVRFVANTIKESQLAAENMARAYITDKKTGLRPILDAMKQEEKNGANAILQKGDKEQRFIQRDEMVRMGASENTIKFVEKIYEIDKVKLDLWNDIRKKFGLPEVTQRPGHFPGVFRGDYKTVVYQTVDGEKRVAGVITADSAWQIDRIKKKVLANPEYKNATFSDMDRRALGGNGRRSDLFSGTSDLLAILARDNPEFAKIQEIARSALPEQADALFGASLHSLNKKGVFGSEGNKFWKEASQNANEAINAYIKYWEEGVYSHLNIPAEAKIKALMDNPALDNHPRAKELANTYVQSATGRNLGSLGDGFNKVIDGAIAKPFRLGPSYPRELINQLNKRAGQWTMGSLNYVFAGVQMAQIFLTAVPRMMSVAHDLGINQVVAPTVAMSKTLKQIPSIFMEHMGMKNDLSPTMKQAVKEAKARGINQFSEFHDVNALTQSKASRVFDATGDFFRERAESYSRSMVFYSFVNMLDGKVPKNQLFDVAYNATQKAMFDYAFSERPMMYQRLGTVGQLAGSLQTFKHNFLSEQASLWKEAARGNPLPALTSTAMLGVFAGITGMPFYDEMDDLVKWVTHKFMGEQKNIEQLVMERLPEWQDSGAASILARGYVSHATGVNLQSRFSSANIAPDSIGQAVSPYAGFYSELGGAAADAISDPQNPQSWKDLAVASSPSTIRPQMQLGMQMHTNNKGERMIMNRKGQNGNVLSDDDITKRRFGFRSQSEALQNERQWIESTRAMRQEDARTAITQRLAKNIRQGNDDKEVLQKYWDLYRERGGQPAAFVTAVKEAQMQRQLSRQQNLQGIPNSNSVPSLDRFKNYNEYYRKSTD